MPEKDVQPYEVAQEGSQRVLRINYSQSAYLPSIEENPLVLRDVLLKLLQLRNIDRVALIQKEEFVYDKEQTAILTELAKTYIKLIDDDKVLIFEHQKDSLSQRYLDEKSETLRRLLMHLLITDPIASYVELKRIGREESIALTHKDSLVGKECRELFINRLRSIIIELENTRILKLAMPFLPGYKLGERTIYKQIFKPEIKPYFIYTKVVTTYPSGADELDSYKVEDNEVTIFSVPNEIRPLYHIVPPEFKLGEELYDLLGKARAVIAQHKPAREEFTDLSRTREVFFDVEKDLLVDLAKSEGVKLTKDKLDLLTTILLRYTIGFGLIEVLLKDPKIQDVSINAPVGTCPVFIIHQDHGECVTNITITPREAESWATKLRMISGRPLDEANPVLDTSLDLPGSRTRVSAIQETLSPDGLAFSFRRHRDSPWTLPLFIQNKMMSPLAAGLLSFFVDGGRSILLAGTRSAGKCVSGDTLIQLADGDIKPISELMSGKLINIEDGTIQFSQTPQIISLNNYKNKDIKVTASWKRESPRELIRIRTQSGREIITTAEHPYFTFDKDIKSIRADSINREMRIAIPRKIKTNSQNIKLNLDAEIINERYILRGLTNSNPVQFPLYMNCELAEFLGYIWGDGTINKTGIAFHNSNDHLRERFRKIAMQFNLPMREYKSRTTSVVQISSRILSKTISELFDIPLGKKSDKISIPAQILKSSDKVLASFLRAYFDCDSCVYKSRGRQIELVTASKSMYRQLQMALLRFGVVTFCGIKIVNNRKFYRVFIRGKFVNKYKKYIGYNHPEKYSAINKCIAEQLFETTNIDSIPDGNYFVKELREKLRMSPKDIRININKDYWAYENNIYNVSRHWFKKYCNLFKEKYVKLLDLKPDIEKLKHLQELLNNSEKFIENIQELCLLINKSYAELAQQTNFSDSAIRNILQKKRNMTLNGLKEIMKLDYSIANAEENYSLKDCLRQTNLSRAELARQTGIPATSIWNYAFDNISLPEGRRRVLNTFLSDYALRFKSNQKRARDILTRINRVKESYSNLSLDFINIGIALSKFRELLNIKNEEFCGDINIQTVSNLFNSTCNPSMRTISAIISKTLGIYESATSEYTLKLIEKCNNLANSDIFWDKVIEVEKINASDGWVYDFTVDPTQNFIANGIFAHNTSLLSALMLEIMRSNRVITSEDTLEIPVQYFNTLGYDIQSLKVQSLITGGRTEVPAEEGIRASLRLGDSCLIVGEVRGKEALALYEAMRVGAMSNVVAGTIHGDSPYSVFDRVVNDLGVPITSFKATDLILVANQIRSTSGLEKNRRLIQLSEVRKFWTKDPLDEKGFQDLLKYNAGNDTIEPTRELLEGDSDVLKSIASRVKEWTGDWESIWRNIELRTNIKQTLVDTATKTKNFDLLEAPFVVMSNDEFHRICQSVKEDVGITDPDRVYKEWSNWLKNQIKKR